MWHDIQQNTDEWMALRAGKVTGSMIGSIMANNGKAFGDPAKNYALDIALHRAGAPPKPAGYSNHHMQRGHEQEPIAKVLYEGQTFVDVTNGGFYDNIETGCSPDGLVDGDGVIEIKCVDRHIQDKTLRRGGIDPAYKWQVLFNLKESRRGWIDFVSYSASFSEKNRLLVYRIEPKEGDFNQIDDRLGDFFTLVDEVFDRVR